MLELIVFGFFVGIALGLSGGGGSILAVPLLVYGAKIPVHQAIVVSLIVVGSTALIGALQRIKQNVIDYRASLIMIVTSVVFAPGGAFLSQMLPGNLIMAGFASLMIIVGISMWVKTKTTLESPKQKHPLLLIIGAALTSFLNGLFGVGGGFLIVPTLLFSTTMPIKTAMASSLLVIACVSFISAATHIISEGISYIDTLLFFLLGGIAGVTVGIRSANKLKGEQLQKGFACMIILLGLLVIVEEFFL